MTDPINPSHYGGSDNPYEAIKVIDGFGLAYGFCCGSALKYVFRAGKKHDRVREDLEKALWYLDYVVEHRLVDLPGGQSMSVNEISAICDAHGLSDLDLRDVVGFSLFGNVREAAVSLRQHLAGIAP